MLSWYPSERILTARCLSPTSRSACRPIRRSASFWWMNQHDLSSSWFGPLNDFQTTLHGRQTALPSTTTICMARPSTNRDLFDTSFLAALAVPSDALHSIANQWSKALAGPFITTEFVLVEFVNMLSAPPRRGRSHALLESLHSNPLIEILPATAEWVQRGLKLHKHRMDQSWSLTDCIAFEVMREVNALEALTHDRHFEQAGFRALLRMSPPL